MQPLKLVALDEQDLAIVSAHAQDAVLKAADIAWLAKERRVLLTMNRFVWEKKTRLFSREHERRRAVLHFEGVSQVRSTGIDRGRDDGVLELLAIRFIPGAAPAGEIELAFAGGATMMLAVDYIEARLADLGGAWATAARPRHGV
jgi:hypothetical protein